MIKNGIKSINKKIVSLVDDKKEIIFRSIVMNLIYQKGNMMAKLR